MPQETMVQRVFREGREGQPILGTCPVCGRPVYANQCCYEPEGHKGKVFLHVGCAESMKTFFIIEVKDSPGNGLVFDSVTGAFNELCPMLHEAEIGEGYTITKSEMTNLKYYALGEHEGI